MRKNILTLAALFICGAIFAQNNLNPTVEVTNTYQGDPSEVHKPQIGMSIPDSLLRFDMDFGYEVFDKPYQGAYNFKPYMLAMKPDKDAYRGRNLYLKAGAGYSLHPQLDFVYSPDPKGPLQMSFFAGHRSYFGKYHSLRAENEDGIYSVTRIPGKSFGGYDFVNTAGFEGSYNFDKAIVSFGAAYKGFMAKDTLIKRSYNAADFNVRVRSNRNDDRYVFYDVAFNGRLDGYKYNPLLKRLDLAGDDLNHLGESHFVLKGEAGPVFSPGQAALLGFEAETVSYSDLYNASAGRLAFIPKFHYRTGKWDLNVGVRIEGLLRSNFSEDDWYQPLFQKKGGAIFPDVLISCDPIENLRVYASATGGNRLNTFSSILSRNHFVNPVSISPMVSVMDNSVEKINAKIGLKGKVGSNLQIEVDGGAAVVDNGLVDSGTFIHLNPSWIIPGVSYANYSLIYADALADLTIGNLRLDGGLHLRHMAFKEDETNVGLRLPLFTCDFKAVYDITSRVYAGMRVISASSRKGSCYAPYWVNTPSLDVTVPGYLDLGLLAGWQFNRKLGFWLESGNLLCETIQRNVFYAEKGLWFTAGITLNL